MLWILGDLFETIVEAIEAPSEKKKNECAPSKHDWRIADCSSAHCSEYCTKCDATRNTS